MQLRFDLVLQACMYSIFNSNIHCIGVCCVKAAMLPVVFNEFVPLLPFSTLEPYRTSIQLDLPVDVEFEIKYPATCLVTRCQQ